MPLAVKERIKREKFSRSISFYVKKNIYYSRWNLVKHDHFPYQHQTSTLKFLPHTVQNKENKEAQQCQTFTGIEISESRFWISPFLCLFTVRYQSLWSAIKHCCPNFNVHYLFLCTFFASSEKKVCNDCDCFLYF